MTQSNIGIKRGFHWQTIHVESANNVVHLHNIKQESNSPL